MKYKIGDKVRVNDKILETEAPPEKKNLAGKILEIDVIGINDKPYRTKQGTLGDSIDTAWSWEEDWIDPITRTLDDIQEGDLLQQGGDSYQRVLGVCRNIVFLTASWRKGEKERTPYRNTYSIQELKYNSYKLVQDNDDECEEAIKTLEKHGRIADGKIIK